MYLVDDSITMQPRYAKVQVSTTALPLKPWFRHRIHHVQVWLTIFVAEINDRNHPNMVYCFTEFTNMKLSETEKI